MERLARRMRRLLWNLTRWRCGWQLYLHRSRAPLDEVDLSTDVERGQRVLDLFQNDCEGMCGV